MGYGKEIVILQDSKGLLNTVVLINIKVSVFQPCGLGVDPVGSSSVYPNIEGYDPRNLT